MHVLAKFICHSIDHTIGQKIVKMSPVITGSEENKSFSSMTPGGSFVLNITNDSPASESFKVGNSYLIDISEAE